MILRLYKGLIVNKKHDKGVSVFFDNLPFSIFPRRKTKL